MKKVLCLITTIVLLVSLLTLPVQAAGLETASSKSNPAAEARSGVVRILSILKVENGRISYSTGSGLAVGNEGESSSIFITNNHVINGAKEVYVLLDNQWEESVPTFGGANDNLHAVKCEIVYTTSGQPDYAILQACRVVTERVSLPLMLSHEANPGDTIFALGYPGVSDDVDENVSADIDSITITRGTISRFTTLESEHSKAIQIDADINKGNSGGPLITEEGYVIGLNTWYVKDEYDSKVCLALEIDYVIDKLNQLVSNGTLADFTFTVIEDRSAHGAGAESPDSTDETTEEDSEGKDLPLLIWGSPQRPLLLLSSFC